jgi:hypothetical protein
MIYNEEIEEKLNEIGDLISQVRETNLFDRYTPSSIRLRCKGSRIWYHYSINKWFRLEYKYYDGGRALRKVSMSFEDVLDLVDDEMKSNLLFHLDLFA